ncbi:MAG: tetratricopeptide repeat protein [Rickettsiales bacterium]|nr:tetratricopeptide repeat protein [Rickettsiales bacterium]
MLRNIKNLLCFTALTLFCANSFAQNPELNDSIVKEIENTLLFDGSANSEVNFYKKKSTKKDDIVINRAPDIATKPNLLVKIDVVEKDVNYAIREKEKTAYNATLIEQYEVAIQLFKDVLAAEPKNSYAKFSLAVIYQKMGQLDQAKVLYRDILKSDPENKDEIIENLLSIFIEETPRDAVYLLARLSVQNPDSAYIAAQSALAYEKIKDYDRAVNMLKKAINLSPDRVDYKYNLAVVFDEMGDYSKAMDAYYDVIKSYDNGGESTQITSVDQIKKRIESIKSNL